MSDGKIVFSGRTDRFSGVTVDTEKVDLTSSEFEQALEGSLMQWKESGQRGVWFKVRLDKTAYVPLLAKHGFDFHHAKKGYVMMTKWLATAEPVSLPRFAFTTIGVAGLVLNDENEILVVKEKYHRTKQWKFPGGYANPGEDLGTTAKREVLEETGIETDFHSVVAFRHHHKHIFGCSDLYVVCLMKPKSMKITKCPYEILESKWMKLSEFKSHSEANGLSRLCVEALEDCQKRGVSIGFSEYFSNITNEFQKVYHLKPTRES